MKAKATREAVRDHAPLDDYLHQNSSFGVLAAKAFTTVLAGFALTSTTLPNISLLPALVAGFLRVLIIARPGMTNLPDFLTSPVPTLARVAKAVAATDFLISQASAMAAVRAPLDITVDFIIGAMMFWRCCEKQRRRSCTKTSL